uniref:M16 family metallopeptidase n=1 Tax=Marinobacterium profundum TaxID=1714300 RepID=UPI0013158911|nr:pitrilysin family protein [Marinobacterium profundum]
MTSRRSKGACQHRMKSSQPRAKGAKVLALLIALSASALSTAKSDPAIERSEELKSPEQLLGVADTFVLKNGLRVVVIPRFDTESVLHMVWYRTGAADDPPGKSGLAHFVEHLTFGSMEMNDRYSDFHALERQAVQLEAYTAYDQTVYYQEVPLEALPLAMSVEAKRMRELSITAKAMIFERKAIRQERADERFEGEGDQHRQLHSALYRGHPYSQSVLGKTQELASITAEDAKAYHRQWYTPNNAVLIIAGPVRTQTLRPVIQEHYVGIPARPLADRRAATASLPQPRLPVTRLHQNWGQTVGIREYLAPSYVTGAAEHTYALQVLAALLGGDLEGRLYRRVVRELGIARDITVTYEPDSVGLAPFTIEVTASSREKVEQALATIDLELNSIRLKGPLETELDHAKSMLLAQTAQLQRDRDAWAERIGTALTSGRTHEDLQAWPERINEVTADDVRRSVHAILQSRLVVTVR